MTKKITQTKSMQTSEKESNIREDSSSHEIEDSGTDLKDWVDTLSLPAWKSVYSIIPSLMAFIFSFNSLWNTFAADDTKQILQNSNLGDIGNFSLAITTSVWGFTSPDDVIFALDNYYRPIFNVAFLLIHSVFGANAWGWHLVCILINAAVVYILFILIKELTKNIWVAFIAAMLFAVHPAHVESVAWISGVTDPLMSLFLLSSLFFYFRFRKTQNKFLIALSILLFTLSMLTKETALILPPVIFYCELFHFETSRPFARRAFSALRITGLYIIPVIGYLALRHLVLSATIMSQYVRYPLFYGLLTIPYIILRYIGLLAIPSGYSYQHHIPLAEGIFSLKFLIPLILLAGAAALVIRSGSKTIRFAFMWFFITLSPSLAVIARFDPENRVQDRYLYLPSIGFFILLAMLLFSVRDRFPFSRFVVPAVTGMIILIFGAVTISQNRVWTNDITLFEHCVSVDPKSPFAHTELARAYSAAGKTKEAEEHARYALELDSKFSRAYLFLGSFAYKTGKIDQSINILKRGAEELTFSQTSQQDLATIYLNWGMILAQKKDYQGAEKMLLKSLEVWRRPTGIYQLALFYQDTGNDQKATEFLEECVPILPSRFAQVHINLARSYDRLGEREKAISEYKKYIDMQSTGAPRDEAIRRVSALER